MNLQKPKIRDIAFGGLKYTKMVDIVNNEVINRMYTKLVDIRNMLLYTKLV
jgi:hypothetical protein